LLLGCGGSDDATITHEVEVLIGEPGAAANAAERALVDRGSEAILFLETGLWRADAPGRKRILRTLERIGDPEALPIAEHVAARDPDPLVRERAADLASALRRSD
jgi:HEAT repeat protein